MQHCNAYTKVISQASISIAEKDGLAFVKTFYQYRYNIKLQYEKIFNYLMQHCSASDQNVLILSEHYSYVDF